MGTWSYFFSSTIISIWLCLSFWVKSHGVGWDVAFCQSVDAWRHEPRIAAARAHGKVPSGSKQRAEEKCSFNPLCYPSGLPGFIKCILVSVMMIWYVNDLCTSGNNSERKNTEIENGGKIPASPWKSSAIVSFPTIQLEFENEGIKLIYCIPRSYEK